LGIFEDARSGDGRPLFLARAMLMFLSLSRWRPRSFQYARSGELFVRALKKAH
jgi:hypothetical protein